MKKLWICGTFVLLCVCIAASKEDRSSLDVSAERSKANRLVAVVFRYLGGDERIVLNDAEREEFRAILGGLQPYVNRPNGRHIPQPYVFVYWTLQESEDQLDRGGLSFNDRGGSINWISDEETDAKVKSLVEQLLKRLKKDGTQYKKLRPNH